MSDNNDEQSVKPPRKEPVLQEMRIVQVAEQPVTAVSTSVDRTPNNPKGIKLVQSKKEREAAEKAKTRLTKSPLPIIKTTEQIIEANNARIDGLDRNAKIDRGAQQPLEWDLEWLKATKGVHIKTAWLQTAFSIANFVSSADVLDPYRMKGLTMSWRPDGLYCVITNNYGSKKFLVPPGNIKAMALI